MSLVHTQFPGVTFRNVICHINFCKYDALMRMCIPIYILCIMLFQIYKLTSEIIAKNITDHFSVGLCPSITTDSTPPPIETHLHSSLKL